MIERAGVSKDTVRRIWNDLGIKSLTGSIGSRCVSNDPRFTRYRGLPHREQTEALPGGPSTAESILAKVTRSRATLDRVVRENCARPLAPFLLGRPKSLDPAC